MVEQLKRRIGVARSTWVAPIPLEGDWTFCSDIQADMRIAPALEGNCVTDDQGFNVEMMYMGKEMHDDFGFRPKGRE